MEIIFGIALFVFIVFVVYRIEHGKPAKHAVRTIAYHGETFEFHFWIDISLGYELPYFSVRKILPSKHFLFWTIPQYEEIKTAWTATQDRVELAWKTVYDYYECQEKQEQEREHVRAFVNGVTE